MSFLKQDWEKIWQFIKVLFSDNKNKPISLTDFFWRVIYAFSCLVVIISFVDFGFLVVAVIPLAYFVFRLVKWLSKHSLNISDESSSEDNQKLSNFSLLASVLGMAGGILSFFNSVPMMFIVVIFLSTMTLYSIPIMIKLNRWLSIQPKNFLKVRNFFIFLGLLILNVVLLIVSLSVEPTFLSALIDVLLLLALLPLSYTIVYVAKAPFKIPQVAVGMVVVLIFVNLIITSFIFGFPTKNIVSVATPTPTISSEPLSKTPYVKNDNVVTLPTSKYSKEFNGLQWWTKEIKEKNLYADIQIKYPQFIGGNEVVNLNKHISNLVFERLEEDRNAVKKWIWEDYCGLELSDGTIWLCSVQLQSEYKVSAIINDIVSIELILINHTGGGVGNRYEPIIINWDLKSNRLLKTEEIFCNDDFIDVLSPLTYEYVRNQFPENILIGYSGIIVVFPPYYVSRGADGIVRIPIPYSSIPDTVCLP